MRRRLATLFLVLAATASASCGSSSVHDPFAGSLVSPDDGGALDASAGDGGDAATGSDAGPLGGPPCTDDPQCDDGTACTYDSCDLVVHRCKNVPDDTQCDNGTYCDGEEKCVAFHGCVPGDAITCDDQDVCTIDKCVEAQKSCTHGARDADGDGDPDAHCVAKHDCDDQDPTVSSTRDEICGNAIDDNCNGVVDETPCAAAQSSTCATALAISAPGTYGLDTSGTTAPFPTTCSVSSPASAHQVVAAITVPAGGARDVDVWATAASGEVAVAIQTACGQAPTEIACGSGAGASSVRALARSLAPGTYFAIVTGANEGPIELAVNFADPTTAPTNVDCAAPAPIVADTPVSVSLVNGAPTLPSGCYSATNELTYAFTLAATSDVRVFGSVTRGSGVPVLTLRAPHCTDQADEISCRSAPAPEIYARALIPGTYTISISGSSPIDGTVLLRTYPATAPPLDQTCQTPPAITANVTSNVDMSNHTDAIKDGCYPGNANAAYDLTLASASDVLLVGRFPQNVAAAVSLDSADCLSSDVLSCELSVSPVRVSKRNVPAGDYRVVLDDSSGQVDQVTAFVRDTVAPVTVAGGDSCAVPVVDIPGSGGFFTGDTSNMAADFDDGCDTNGGPGGAPDQVMRLVLTQARHVIFDSEGSQYATIIDVRTGATCPGTEVAGDCYVGFGASRSFIDTTLAAGTYWIVIDGFGGQKGPWNLDVRVLPP